jgi:hypothetical protein
MYKGPLWSWSYGSWIYKYPCNQCLLPLTLWVQIPLWWGVLDTTLCDKVYQWLAAGRWFSLETPVSSTNKTDLHNITEILLKVVLNTMPLYLYKIIKKMNWNVTHFVTGFLPHTAVTWRFDGEFEEELPIYRYKLNWLIDRLSSVIVT